MPNLLAYMDYRKFLADFYHEVKGDNPGFSFREFSEACGFRSKGVISNLISGRANLARKSIPGILQYLELSAKEANYFEILVEFNQAKNTSEKNRLYAELESIRIQRKEVPNTRVTRKHQYEFYSEHYHSVIRSLIDLYEFKDDYGWLAKSVQPPITPGQAKNSVKLQEKLGLINRNDLGIWKLSDSLIKASREILEMGTLNFHTQAINSALYSMERVTNSERYLSGLTLGISQKSYEKIKSLLDDVQDKILGLAEADEEADEVFQLNFQMFQAAQPKKHRK